MPQSDNQHTQSASETTLFRPDFLGHSERKSYGEVRISQPIGSTTAAILGIGVAITVVSFAIFGSYTKRATVTGLVTPKAGAIRVFSQVSGLVTEVNVNEGSKVASGDVLFVVSAERQSEFGGTQALIARELVRRAEIAKRDAILSKARADERVRSLSERVRGIEIEIVSFQRDSDVFTERERIARDSYKRHVDLAEKGFMSTAQADAQREAVLSLQAQRQVLLRNKASLERERVALIAQIDEARLQLRADTLELEKASALLSQETSENQVRMRSVVVSPANGVVTGVAVAAGQTVGTGTVLATLLPGNTAAREALPSLVSPSAIGGDAELVKKRSAAEGNDDEVLEVHLFATTRQAGFVEKNQSVRLRFAAFPYQKFGIGEGTVADVSRSPYAVQELPTHIASSLVGLVPTGDSVYRVTVRLKRQNISAYGIEHALRAGMLVEGDIIQDQRKLWEWALEPLLSVTGRLAR